MPDASDDPGATARSWGTLRPGGGRSALLWGAVGVLAYLVLLLGYEAVVAPIPVGPGAKLAIAVAAGVVPAAVAFRFEGRLAGKGRS